MEQQKRKRAANFSDFETDIVAELVQKYKHVIENKKTDGVTVKKKDETWNKIAEEFNSIAGVSCRNARNLKVCYENLKRKTRKICADSKMFTKITGGGESQPPISKTTEKVMALIGPTITPLTNAYDSDAVHQEYGSDVIVVPFDDITEAEVDEDAPPIPLHEASLKSTQTASTSSHAAHASLASKSDSTLFEKSRKLSTPKEKIKDSCEKRISVLDYQLEVMRKEHEKEMEIKDLKISIMKEKLKYWQNMNKMEDR